MTVPFRLAWLAAVAAVPALSGLAVAADWGNLSGMHNYEDVFGLAPGRAASAYTVTMLDSNAPGNVFHPGERPKFTLQIANLADRPLHGRAKVEVIRYSQSGRPGDNWWPELDVFERLEPMPLEVDVEPKGWANLTIEPAIPETKGGYGLVIDLPEEGRRYLTSCVRTFKPELRRVQFPKQSLEDMPAPILARLGVQAIRWAVPYHPSDSQRYDELWERISEELSSFHENKVTVVAEIGAGSAEQPLDRGRPHLDDRDVMKDGKQDLVWLPECDDDYQEFVSRLVRRFGWPKGPITGVMLWNEPWEGLSISGWGADMIRYRELYKRMGDAVFQARGEAGVDVLIGGCDSSANTWDKLFPDGTDTLLPYLDFCSIHYQGLSAPVLHPEWNNRTFYKGRVLIWDTESWVANTDDRFAGVVAANRAAGYDRSMGTLSRIAVSTLSHRRVAKDRIRTADGTETVERLIESRPLAAAYGAVQHFIGEREFREIVFQNGLPWVFAFHGLDSNPDDGTAVVVGDLASLFQKGTPLFSSVKKLDGRDATMTIDAAGKPFSLCDFYGNPVLVQGGKIAIPLSDRGYFLRADPKIPGSFAALLEAIRTASIDGLEPVEILAYDMTSPVEAGPVLRLRMTSMHNRSIEGSLDVTLGGLEVECPKRLSFAPRERKWIEVQVSGRPRPDNTYPLKVRFDAGRDGAVVHDEPMHVNWISRKAIAVDGRLDDWQGALPQTIHTEEAAEQSFEEAMYLPFEKFQPGQAGGFAVAYLAYDDDSFYFAAKIADDTPQPGTVRFATRDEDADFYPEVSYSRPDAKKSKPKRGRGAEAESEPSTELVRHVWPEGVRRFSYRRWPDIPSGMPQNPFDNVLLAFNAIPPDRKDWLTHLPGRMPKFVRHKTTDYEYALNKVADEHGGGTEIWRLLAPGMPYKHFFPRQPKHPLEGPVAGGRLAVVYQDGARLVECSLPWSEIPAVKRLLDAGRPVKFDFRVNHETRGPDMELAIGRSAAEGISPSFHPNWIRSAPNELEFGWEK